MFNGLAKYILGYIRSSSLNDEEIIVHIEKVLHDTFNDKILSIVNKPIEQWGECARSVNKVVKEIMDNLIKEFS